MRRLLGFVLALCLGAASADAGTWIKQGPVYHAAAGGGSDVAVVTSATGSINGADSFSTGAINPGAGTHRAMFIGIAFYHGGETATVSSVVHNSGTPGNFSEMCTMTSMAEVPTRRVTIWKLVAPANESATVTVTFASGGGNVFAAAVVTAFTGVDQTTPGSGCVAAEGESTTPSVTATTMASGDMVFDTIHTTGTAGVPSVGASQTSSGTAIDGDSVARVAASTQAGADGGAMTWTITSQRWLSRAVTVEKG